MDDPPAVLACDDAVGEVARGKGRGDGDAGLVGGRRPGGGEDLEFPAVFEELGRSGDVASARAGEAVPDERRGDERRAVALQRPGDDVVAEAGGLEPFPGLDEQGVLEDRVVHYLQFAPLQVEAAVERGDVALDPAAAFHRDAQGAGVAGAVRVAEEAVAGHFDEELLGTRHRVEWSVVAVLLPADEQAAAVVTAKVGDDDVVADLGRGPVGDEDAAAVVVVERPVAEDDVAADLGRRPVEDGDAAAVAAAHGVGGGTGDVADDGVVGDQAVALAVEGDAGAPADFGAVLGDQVVADHRGAAVAAVDGAAVVGGFVEVLGGPVGGREGAVAGEDVVGEDG